MQDVVTLERRAVERRARISTRRRSTSIIASPDGRTLYYGARQIEANIWMVRRAAPSTH